MKKIFYILFFVFSIFALQAQQPMKVVTRVIEKEYSFNDEFLLDVDGEKANIDIKVVSGNTVRLVLKQTAIHAKQEIAKKELGYIHFVEKKERNRLYINNYAQLEANSKGLSSIITNEYVLEVPRYCHLKVKNELGDINVSGIEKTMRFNIAYCSLKINNSSGKLYVDSRIGDLTLNDTQIDADLILDNVATKFQKCKGSFDIQAQFGSISCVMSEHLTLFKANVEHCDITMINRTNIDYSYAINITHSNLETLDDTLGEYIEKNKEDVSLHLKNTTSLGAIIIDSEYGDVQLY